MIFSMTRECGFRSPPSSVMIPAVTPTTESGMSRSARGMSLGRQGAARVTGSTRRGIKAVGRIVKGALCLRVACSVFGSSV